jgi:HlyD family secretion protein
MSLFSKVVMPALALAGTAYCAYAVTKMRQEAPPTPPLVPPVARPAAFSMRIGGDDPAAARVNRLLEEGRVVAGSGLVEARRENIPIGSPVPGIVWEVFVKVGDRVEANAPLFRLDDREVRGALLVAEAQRDAARAQLDRLRVAPRPEDLPPLRAAVAEAEAKVKDTKSVFDRSSMLIRREGLTDSEYDRDRYAHLASLAGLERAKADLARVQAGSWEQDIKVAEAELARAQAQVDKAKLDLDRLTVRALVEGQVLKVDVRPGQLATTVWNTAMVVLGDLTRLHVRVDLDEHDLHKFREGIRAFGTPRGRPQDLFELEFVKVEPYVVPKRSLTGDNAERVDTRVLQVIYAVKPREDKTLYVGQQMDVYLEAPTEVAGGTTPGSIANDSPIPGE